MNQRSTLAIARSTLEPFLRQLVAKQETLAVCLLSNAAATRDRLPFDEHSDFDVGLVIDVPIDPAEWRPLPFETYRLVEDRIPAWVPNFSFHVPVPWGHMEVNVNQLLYQYEADPRTIWGDGKCEAYGSTAEFLFDRDHRFERLIEEKADTQAATRRRRLTRLANRLDWDIRVLPRRQAARGEIEGAHLIVNEAIEELLELLFLSSGRFIPSLKWRLHVLRERNLLSRQEHDRITAALRCDPTSRADLERRVKVLDNLWASVRARVDGLPRDAYRTFSASQLQLRRRTAADMCAELLGGKGYDMANYLLADSPNALLRRDAAQLPSAWSNDLRAAQEPAT
jgi:hypothetical protein